LDGHALRFGPDPQPGEPAGDWLDEDGNLWRGGKIVSSTPR